MSSGLEHVNGAVLEEEDDRREVHLSMEQENAIDLCCDLSITIAGVTGEAGTGKTLVLGKSYEQVHKRRPTVLCAPTGRAAKRIQELTGIKAKTIHRLLRFPMPDDFVDDAVPGEPLHNAENPLAESVVFVDESSMLSPTLYQQLINALPKGGVIRFFGDNNQLPPVEEGSPPFVTVLEDFPSVTLSFNFRSDDEIVSNAHRVLNGRLPIRNARFEIFYVGDPCRYAIKWAPSEFTKDDHQILTPTRRGKYGSMRLNPSLQVKYNKQEFYLAIDRYNDKEAKLLLKPGDKFIWTKNDYTLNMFNGEVGEVLWIDDESGAVGLGCEGREIEVPPRATMFHPYVGHNVSYDPRKAIELGYAITTHKAQGSEFKTVLIVLSRSQYITLNRRNFYTAITRAKQNVVVICDRAAMSMSMRQWHPVTV